MRKEDIKIGMKVVPFQKTAHPSLEFSSSWRNANKINQPFLYVIKGGKDIQCWVLDEEKDSGTGDFFNSCDFNPYVENENKIKGRLMYKEDDREYGIIGTETSLKDIQDEPLFVGDVVEIGESPDSSIVCTQKGDIMGLWGGYQDRIENYKVKKVKSYVELKDGEIYRNCVKVVLDEDTLENLEIKKEQKIDYMTKEFNINSDNTYEIVFKTLADINHKTHLEECMLNTIVGKLKNFSLNGVVAIDTEHGLQIINGLQIVQMLVLKEDLNTK